MSHQGPQSGAAGGDTGVVGASGLPPGWKGGSSNSQPASRMGPRDVSPARVAAPVPAGSPQVPVSAAAAALPVGHDRAAALFRAYDVLGRGALDRPSMVAALAELGVAAGLGEEALNQVLSQDPASSREHRYTLQQFLSMYERLGQFAAKAARGERIRALSGVPQPPPGAERSPALRAVFNAYSRYGAGTSRALVSQAERGLGFNQELEPRMNTQQLMRLCQDLELVASSSSSSTSHPGVSSSIGSLPPGGFTSAADGTYPLTFSSVDVAFAKSKAPGGPRRLSFPQWLRALAALSDESGRDLFAIMAAHVTRIQRYAPPGALEALIGGGSPALGPTGPLLPRAAGGASTTGAGSGGLPKLGALGGVGAKGSPQSSPMQALSPGVGSGGGGVEGEAAPPGRLTLLEKALMEEDARAQAAEEEAAAASAAQAARAAGRSPMALRQSGGGGGRLPPRGVSAGAPRVPGAGSSSKDPHGQGSGEGQGRYEGEGGAASPGQPIHAWGEHSAPDEAAAAAQQQDGGAAVSAGALAAQQAAGGRPGSRQVPTRGTHPTTTNAPGQQQQGAGEGGGAVGGGEGGSGDGVVSPSGRGQGRARSAGPGSPARTTSPGRAAIKVHMVHPAKVMTEVWKLPPGMGPGVRSSADEGPPPWLDQLLERLAYLEGREAERSGREELDQQEAEQLLVRVEKVEAAMAKGSGALEQRVAALERHATRAERSLADLGTQIETVASSNAAAAALEAKTGGGETDGPLPAAVSEAVAALSARMDEEIPVLLGKIHELDTFCVKRDDFVLLTGRMDDIEGQAASAAGVEEISNRMDALEAKLGVAGIGSGDGTGLPASRSGKLGSGGAAEELATRVSELEEGLGGIASAMQAISKDQTEAVAAVEEKVAALAARVGAGGGGGEALLGAAARPGSAAVGGDAAAVAAAVQRDLHIVQERFKVNESMLVDVAAKLDGIEASLGQVEGLRSLANQAFTTARTAENRANDAISKQQLEDRLQDLRTEISSAAAAAAFHASRGSTPSQPPSAAPPLGMLPIMGSSGALGGSGALGAGGAVAAAVAERALSAALSAQASADSALARVAEAVAAANGVSSKVEEALSRADAAGAVADGAMAKADEACDRANAAGAAADAVSQELQEVRALAVAAGSSGGSGAAVAPGVSQSDLDEAVRRVQSDILADMAQMAAEMEAAGVRLGRLEQNAVMAEDKVAGAPAPAPASAADGKAVAAQVAAALQPVTSRLDQLEGAAKVTKDLAHATQDNIDAVKQQLGALQQGVAAAQAAATAAQQQAASASSAAASGAAAAAAGGASAARLDSLDSQLASVGARIRTMEDALSRLAQAEAAVAAGKAAQDALASKLAAAEMTANTASLSASKVSTEMNAMVERFDDLEHKLQQVQAAAAAGPVARNPSVGGEASAGGGGGGASEGGAARSVGFADGSMAGEDGEQLRSGSGRKGGIARNKSFAVKEAAAEAVKSVGDVRNEVDALKRKMQQLFQQVSDLKASGGGGSVQRQQSQSQLGGEGSQDAVLATGPVSTPGGVKVNMGLTMTPAQQIAQLQQAQMATAQQMGMVQGSMQQLMARLAQVEAKGGAGAAAGAKADEHTAAQLELLQGALVQLNGEVTSLKLAVPQLSAAQSRDSGGVTMAALGGAYGPEIAALAEEAQRAAVRAEVVERDVRVALTGFARAADIGALEAALRERVEGMDSEIEGLRQAVRRVVEDSQAAMGRGGGGAGPRGTTAAGPRGTSAMPGNEGGGGGGDRHYATWDALRHAEQALARATQAADEKATTMVSRINDVNSKIDQLAGALAQRLEVKEKVLMKVAKEVEELRESFKASMPKSMAMAAAAKVHDTRGSGGGSPMQQGRNIAGGQLSMRTNPAAAGGRPGRSSMFDE